MEHCYEVGTVDSVAAFVWSEWGGVTAPFLGKHARSTGKTPVMSTRVQPSTSAQQMICLGWRGERASFLSQWRYSCFRCRCDRLAGDRVHSDLSHPRREAALPLALPVAMQIRVEQDEIDVSFEQIETTLLHALLIF